MRNLFFALAFMIVGAFTLANTSEPNVSNLDNEVCTSLDENLSIFESDVLAMPIFWGPWSMWSDTGDCIYNVNFPYNGAKRQTRTRTGYDLSNMSFVTDTQNRSVNCQGQGGTSPIGIFPQ